MKRFMMALFAISALNCFAAEGGDGQHPSLLGCMAQAFQGTQALLQDTVEHLRVQQAMQRFGRVVNVIMEAEHDSVADLEAAENHDEDQDTPLNSAARDNGIIDDAGSTISQDNNSLSDVAREEIAELQAKVGRLENELKRRRRADEEDMLRAQHAD